MDSYFIAFSSASVMHHPSYWNKATAEALILNYFEVFKVENHPMYISKWMYSAYLKENFLELKIIGMHLSICFIAV